MDRTFRVLTHKGVLFAEFHFHYDNPQEATARYTQYRSISISDDDEIQSVYPAYMMNLYLPYIQFGSIKEAQKHDIDLAIKELGRDMTNPSDYTYVHDPEPVRQRYLLASHIGCIGIADVTFSFIQNMKEVKFISAMNPNYDADISSNGLETNVDCILRMPVYGYGDERTIHPADIKRL